MLTLGVLAASLVQKILDTFTRVTSGSLGSADSGQTWTSTNGIWQATGSVASSNGDGYAIASIPFNKNATVSASTALGSGIAFWVSDAQNWYATSSYRTVTSYSCGCSTCYNTCADPACGCAVKDCAVGVLCALGTQCCDANSNRIGTPYCAAYKTCATAGCGSYTCGCSTCSNEYYWLSNLKSVAGSVSSAVSDVAVSGAALSIKAVINGSSVTTYAYSDSNLSAQIGTASFTATPPSGSVNVGIMSRPGYAASIDNFSAS